MFRRAFFPLIVLSAGLTPAIAQDIGDPEHGAALFQTSCAACHGPEARGDGPMAPALATPPADLTALSGGGDFPLARTVQRIDGRNLIAHGGPMPLFGDLLIEQSAVVDGEDGNPVFTTQAVLDIVAWLMTVQTD